MAFKRLFIDSDVILDLFLERQPFYKFSQTLLNWSTQDNYSLCTSALVIANVYYFLNKASKDSNLSKQKIELLTHFISILPVGFEDILAAIHSTGNDFEDSIQIHVAQNHNCDAIITRNTKDYKHSAIPVLTAEQFLHTL
jgi:predicted nucleic acid-binding protein